MSRRSDAPPGGGHHLPRAGAVGGVGHPGRRAPRAVRRRRGGRGRRTGAATARIGVRRRRGCRRVPDRRARRQRRCGRRSCPLRRGAAPEHRGLARGPRRLGDGVAARGRRRRPADPRRLSRDAADGGRRRRLAGAAHARPGRARRAQPGRRCVRHDRGHDRGGLAARARWSGLASRSGVTTTRPSRRTPASRPTAWAADGSLEAMERPGPRFCLAVQWHPEVRDDASLFAGLVAAATARAG